MLNAAAPLELVLFTFPIKIILFSQSSHLLHLIYIQACKTIVSISSLFYGQKQQVRHSDASVSGTLMSQQGLLPLQWELTCSPRDSTPAAAAKMHFTLASFSQTPTHFCCHDCGGENVHNLLQAGINSSQGTLCKFLRLIPPVCKGHQVGEEKAPIHS